MLLFARQVIRCGVSAKVLLKATLISASRLGCFTYSWLILLEFVVQFMWIVVLSCSARMAFLTPFSMMRISECWLCLCENAKFEALQHAPSLVISWLCTSLSMSYLVRTGLAARHRHSCGRTYRQVPVGHRSVCVCARAHTHTHKQKHRHTHTHTLWHIRLAQAWFWRRLLASAGHIWAGSSCLFWLNLARLGGDYGSWCRRYDGGMCYLLEVSPVSLVMLAIRLALLFILTHTCAHAQKHTPGPGRWRLASAGHKSLWLVLIFWQNLIGHGDDVWRACVNCCACCWFGTVASLWLACLQLDYLPCLATWKLDFFFFGETLSDVVAICTSWCQWYEEVVHGSIGCRASSAIYLGLYFHCASHAACTHTPFQKLAIALAIVFSSESVLKYERLKHKKKKLECLVVVFPIFFLIFFIERNFFLMKGEEKLEYMRWQGSSV